MAVGAATVELPRPNSPVAKPLTYDPPEFVVCIHQLHERGQAGTAAQLKSLCRKTYEHIRTRILNFLITGYWLRREAARDGVGVPRAAVHNVFEQEKHINYPTATAFKRLQEASKQTIPDLEFAVETQMLSSRLLAKFAKEHPHEKEQATVADFNQSIRRKWIPRTSCEPGYVVPDCKQFKS